jgi:hypothetical protein
VVVAFTLAALVAVPILAGFAGTDLFIPMAGRGAGVYPSNWFTTVYLYNPNLEAVTVDVTFLERNKDNVATAPPKVTDTLAAGESRVYDNIVETTFGTTAYGAVRIQCASRVVASARVFSKESADAPLTQSFGQDFAATPASFAIGLGESTDILGGYSTIPYQDSQARFNIGCVETTGAGSATVRWVARDAAGQPQKQYDRVVPRLSQTQGFFHQYFDGIDLTNSRVSASVISGGGRVICYGSLVTNDQELPKPVQDPTTFEMVYPATALGIAGVQHDATLAGDGTEGSPLGIRPSPVADQVLVSVPIAGSTSGDGASAIFANAVEWRDPGTLALGLAPGGVAFGNGTGGLGQDAANLFWDGTNRRLGIGTATPHYQLELTGSLKLPWSAGTGGALKSGALLIGDYWFLHGFGSPTNAFVGSSAGNFSLTSTYSTGVGYGALNDVTTGAYNTAVGASSLTLDTTGGSNTAVGAFALESNAGGSHNTAVGARALRVATAANDNTALGSAALSAATGGTRNTAVGSQSMTADVTSNYNTAVGAYSLHANTAGGWNTALGDGSLAANTEGSNNTAAGTASLQKNTTGGSNAAFGYAALAGNTEGYNNVGIGTFTLYKATTASGNTAVGCRALSSTTTALSNTAVGSYALESDTTGFSNTALGESAMLRNTTGSANTAVGVSALYENSGGSRNAVVGAGALAANTGGSDNSGVGREAMSRNTTGERNSAIGGGALHEGVSGSNNTALGYHAGYAATGSGNVFLGYNAGAEETGSNRLYVANTSGSALVYGQFDTQRVAINATDPTQTLDVNGCARIRGLAAAGLEPVYVGTDGVLKAGTPSDARLKRDVRPLDASLDALDALAGLRAVSYAWDTAQPAAAALGSRREIGLLAQEVERVLPELVSIGGDGYRSVDYARLTAFLVEVARAQQREIEALREEVATLRR